MTTQLITFKAPQELIERFDRLVAMNYQTRSARLRAMMEAEIRKAERYTEGRTDNGTSVHD